MNKSLKKEKHKLLRVGLVGCGRISQQHLASINHLKKHIKLVAVCDSDRKKAREAGLKYRVPFYTDYKKLLRIKEIDLIVVCTPNGLHYSMGMAVARAGKHVLLEKPLALNLKHCDELIETFQRKKKKLMVVMQVRYNKALRALKKAIAEGKLGKIYNVALAIRWQRPQSYFKEAAWRGKKALDGGALLNQGSHYIDALTWLFGQPKTVYGKVDRVAHQIEMEDEAFALMQFENGAYGLMEFTINTYPRNFECSLTVLGQKGTVRLAGQAINEIEHWEVKNCPQPAVREKTPAGFTGVSPHHLFIYQDVVNYFAKGRLPFFSGSEARKPIEIIEAIHRSAKQRKEIKL